MPGSPLAARAVTALLAGALLVAAAGCGADTVRLDSRPEVGDRSRHRYELEATITRSLEGEPSEVSEVDVTVETEAEVVEVTADGVRAEVTIRREGAEPTTAQVLLGRGGTLEGLELVEGLPPEATVLGGLEAVLGTADIPPDVPLRPGQRWLISDGAVAGEGRLQRLGVVDGEHVAVVRTAVAEPLSPTAASALDGELRTRATTSYDLADGSIRRSTSASKGTVEAVIQPPAGVDAQPVHATIRYDVEVRVVRLD
jgi:hypothetical protein